MEGRFSRAERLLGRDALERLEASHVAVFGIGGVGSYAAEALARSGIGTLSLFDGDRVALSNCNRQLIALESTLGQPKVQVMANRIRDINPQSRVIAHQVFYGPDTADEYDLEQYDCIVDAIDTVTCKLLLIERAQHEQVPAVSCMGAGNKLDPTRFEAADIYETSVCPLARVMRTELRKRGVKQLRVVYSKEPAFVPQGEDSPEASRRQTPGSVAFVPPAAGLILAAETVKLLLKEQPR